MSRIISEKFAEDLKSGRLAPLAQRVRHDDTLMLALRGTSINIYYRGGSILQLVEEPASGKYAARFDSNYVKADSPPHPELPKAITTEADCQEWLRALPHLKEVMNFHMATQASKSEREFQQLVAWENNRSKLANETDYFITDIEFATDVKMPSGDVKQARLDMLGLKWLTKERKKSICTPVFIEMKYGTAAYTGKAGIVDHINDLNAILNEGTQGPLGKTIADQFNQLDELELVDFMPPAKHDKVEVVGKPEVIFLLANNNPRSGVLSKILEKTEPPTNYDLRFFVASFAGYAMHEKCMMDLGQFRTWIADGAKMVPA